MAGWRVFSKLLVCTSLVAVVSCVKMCENITVTSCSRAGYNTTARFPYVNGKRHQDLAAMNTLGVYIPLLHQCSPYASTILCSLYLPKCVEGINRPIPPCRRVCQQFAQSCQTFLRAAAVGGLFTSLCDLLPEEPGSSNKCFYPDGFKKSGGKV